MSTQEIPPRRVVYVSDKLLREIAVLAVKGLTTDGGHHKQWYLEQIAAKLGYDENDLREHFDYQKGIAP